MLAHKHTSITIRNWKRIRLTEQRCCSIKGNAQHISLLHFGVEWLLWMVSKWGLEIKMLLNFFKNIMMIINILQIKWRAFHVCVCALCDVSAEIYEANWLITWSNIDMRQREREKERENHIWSNPHTCCFMLIDSRLKHSSSTVVLWAVVTPTTNIQSWN